MGVLLLVLVLYVILFIIGIILYIIGNIGLTRIGQHNGLGGLSLLAWIPIAQLFLIGLIAQDSRPFGIYVPHLEIVLPVFAIVGSVVASTFDFGFLLMITYLIFTFGVIAEIMGHYSPQWKWVFAFFSPIGFHIIGRKIVRSGR